MMLVHVGGRLAHAGVETEWATACVFSGFNLYMDADACCIGSMGNAALWQHHPLPDQLTVCKTLYRFTATKGMGRQERESC